MTIPDSKTSIFKKDPCIFQKKGKKKGKTISVRINSPDTHYMYKDLIDIVEEVGEKLDTILYQKLVQLAMFT